MENDLIRRKDLAEGIACHKQYTDQEYETDRQWALGYNAGIERALFSIRYARGIEAEPVRHGRWKQSDFIPGLLTCTNCGIQRNPNFKLGGGMFNYCPNCGAKMDAKEE